MTSPEDQAPERPTTETPSPEVPKTGTRRRPPWLYLWAALGSAGFFILAQIANRGEAHVLDNRILLALRESGDPSQLAGPGWLREFMTDATALAGWPVLTMLTIILGVFLAMRAQWRSTALLLAAVIGEAIIVSRFKALFERARPDVVPHLVEAVHYSFPSGHAASAAAVYLTLAAILSRQMDRRRERAFVAATAVFLVVLVGVSRVVLGVHYPTDVLAGWCFGSVWASLVWLAANRIKTAPPRRS